MGAGRLIYSGTSTWNVGGGTGSGTSSGIAASPQTMTGIKCLPNPLHLIKQVWRDKVYPMIKKVKETVSNVMKVVGCSVKGSVWGQAD